MRSRHLLTTCAAAMFVAACSGGPDATDNTNAPPPRSDDSAAPAQACEDVFADAAAGDGELEAALTVCEDVAAVAAAAQAHPDALGDTEPQVWLAEACTAATDPRAAESSLCLEVAGEEPTS